MALLVLCAPALSWMYHIDRAGALLARGLEHPQYQPSDYLATARDKPAVDAALRHAEAAIRLRPDHGHAYRMAADALAANGAWLEAAETLAQARALMPSDKVLAWRQSLVLERSIEAASSGPRETILPDLASAPVEAPATSVATPYCGLGDPASCYVGLSRMSQPLAMLASAPDVPAEVLFMHPPASVTLTHPIYADHPVLSFMIGMDPAKATGTSDGAGFEIWGASPGAARSLLFEHTFDAASARLGWAVEHVDLTRWAGEQVELTFKTTGGPSGDTTDDWFAWADVMLVSPAAALPQQRINEALLRQAWIDAGLDGADLMARGDEELRNGRAAAAATWYGRAFRSDSGLKSLASAAFRAQIAHIAATQDRLANVDVGRVLVHELSGSVRVPGTELQWMRSDPAYNVEYGSPLGEFGGPDPALGIMWWGGRAVTVIDVKAAGAYRISVRARNAAPAPTELLIEHNFAQLAPMTLAREDESTELLALERHLEPGLHVLGVNFLNDGALNGVDRNAVIESIEIVGPAVGATGASSGASFSGG